MAETDNYQIWSPDYGDEWSLPIDLGAMAESVDTALVGNLWYFAGPESAMPEPGVSGRRYYATDTGADYIDSGSAWVPFDSGTVNISTFGSNWSATAGYQPFVRRTGRRVDLFGAVTIATGADFTNILTVPPGYRPPRPTFLGSFFTTNGESEGQLHITSGGVVQVTPPYRSGSMSAGRSIPLTGSWYID